MPAHHRSVAAALRVERLDDRVVPALTFQFDYSRDATGFFADPARRAVLEQVGRDVGGAFDTTPRAIAPAGDRQWTARFYDPATGAVASVENLSVAEGVLTVFVGARSLPGAEAANGGYGGSAWRGDWGNLAESRGGSLVVWGGSLTFDAGLAWYTGDNPAAAGAGQFDLYTVAAHELGHLLGIGTAPRFHALSVGGVFVGPASAALYGGPVPLAADGEHFAQAVAAGGQTVSLRPTLAVGRRYGLSALDFAALADVGWQVSADALRRTPAPAVELVAAGGAGGQVRLLDPARPNAGVAAANLLTPFPGFGGVVRAVGADVTGDGVTDWVAVTGPGGGSRVRVVDGATGADALADYAVFEPAYTGGLYVAAADLDGDGKAEVVVTPDQGGGARVVALAVGGGTARRVADFLGIDDPNFRGGARVALGDVTGDGTPDLVVAAGFGGGPRVAVFDGTTLAAPRRVVGDFLAFDGPDAETLRNGVFVAAGDLDGDGLAELVFGGGPGGGPRVLVVSGARLLAEGRRAALVADFFAFDAAERGGVRPAVRDVNGDGTAELLLGSGAGARGRVRVHLGAVETPVATLEPFGSDSLIDGVFVG